MPSNRDAFSYLDFDTSKGVVYSGSTQSLTENLFPKLKLFNPKMRIILLLLDFDELLIPTVLLEAWEQFKLLNIYIVDYRNEQKIVYGFNPFNKTFVNFNFHLKKQAEFRDQFESFARHRVRNLFEYSLRTTFFKFFMVADGETDDAGNFKLDSLRFSNGEALRILSKVANFTVEFVKTLDGVTYGWKTANGSYTGNVRKNIF